MTSIFDPELTLRTDARAMFDAALEVSPSSQIIIYLLIMNIIQAANPAVGIRRALCVESQTLVANGGKNREGLRYKFDGSEGSYKRIVLVGSGKAAVEMCAAVEGILDATELREVPREGHVVTKHGHGHTRSLRTVHVSGATVCRCIRINFSLLPRLPSFL